MSAGTVSVTIEAWDALRDRLRKQDEEIEKLKGELSMARLGDISPEKADVVLSQRYRIAAQALDAAIVIVNFAVGNLHPLTVRGWPYERLRTLRLELLRLQEASGYTVAPELLVTWLEFTRWCQKWEDARAAGIEQAVLLEENATRAISPEKAAEYGLTVVATPDSFSGDLLPGYKPQVPVTTPAAVPPVADGTSGGGAADGAPATTTTAV